MKTRRYYVYIVHLYDAKEIRTTSAIGVWAFSPAQANQKASDDISRSYPWIVRTELECVLDY